MSLEEGTQAKLAYRELSHRIAIQDIAPNQRIKEQLWSQKLKLNRAANREGLTRLLGEGVVRRGEHGGFFVTEMSEKEIHEVRDVREILESAAFALACDRASQSQIREIENTCDDFAS